MTLTWFIYGLIDPRDGSIRYIGRTADPRKRMELHRTNTTRKTKAAWFVELRKLGMEPTLCVFEKHGDWPKAKAAEIEWLKRGFESGWPLFNSRHLESGCASGRPRKLSCDETGCGTIAVVKGLCYDHYGVTLERGATRHAVRVARAWFAATAAQHRARRARLEADARRACA